MARRRKNRDATFKARVALEAVKEREAVSEQVKSFEVHPTKIYEWKRRLIEWAASLQDDRFFPIKARRR